tara:strand:- start:289 stop:603 length:315 start_codon:yes stop_codon:yes gene_type:complete
MENKDEYKFNHVEETIEQVGTPDEREKLEYDDSFMDKEDKIQLIKCILTELNSSPNHRWCDQHLINCLASYKYKQTIINMDVDAYKREKEELDKNPLSILTNKI